MADLSPEDQQTAMMITHVVHTGDLSGGPTPRLDAEVRTKRNRVIRRELALGFWERVDLVKRIADGTEAIKQDVVTHKGDVVVVEVAPTFTERLRAIEMMGKFGRITEEDDPELPPERQQMDLSKLNDGELATLESLLKKAGVTSRFEPSAEVTDEDAAVEE